jgi:hypothetical protein
MRAVLTGALPGSGFSRSSEATLMTARQARKPDEAYALIVRI